MKMVVSPNGVTISSTGDKSYGSTAAVSNERYTNLTGKVMEISKTVDGLVVKHEDLLGNISGLEFTINSYKTYVDNNFVSEDGFEEKYKSVSAQTSQEINDHFEALDKFKNDTTANIKTGLLGYTDDNQPMYGIEIGQETKDVNGEVIFDKYARFSADKLSFYDQNSIEVASMGDKKMHVSNIEITGVQTEADTEYGSFKHGKFVDVALANGTIVSKWVGGG